MPHMSPNIKARKGRLVSAVVTIVDPRLNSGSPLNAYTVAGLGSPKAAIVMASATAIDATGGDVSASLVWTSSLDGTVGTGTAPLVTLSQGTHTLTAAVGASSDSITVIVT